MSHYINTQPEEEMSHAERIQQNSVALDISFHKLGTARVISNDLVETEVNKDWLRVQKDMLKSGELKAIQTYFYFTDKWIKAKSLPSLYRRGVYLVPINSLTEIADFLETRRIELQPLVDDFVATYPDRIEEARQELGEAFNESNYPSVDEVRDAFGIDYRFINIGTPGVVQGVSRAIYLREQARVKAQFEEAAAVLMATMRESSLKLVQSLRDRLDTPVGQKPKVFKESTITKLYEWANNYVNGLSDVVLDEKLKPIAEQIMMITDVDPVDVRKDVAFKDHINREMGKVEESLKKLIVDRPKRAISFE
jgi:hypothetical protein